MKKIVLMTMMLVMLSAVVLADCGTVVEIGERCNADTQPGLFGLFSVRGAHSEDPGDFKEEGRDRAREMERNKTREHVSDDSSTETEDEVEVEQEDATSEPKPEELPEPKKPELAPDEGGKPFNRTEFRERFGEFVRVRLESGEIEDRVDLNSTVPGLENAILRVRKNETREHLQEVLARIEAHRAEIIAKLNETIVQSTPEGDLEIHGKGPVKFLGVFDVEYDYQYDVDGQTGTMTRKPKWFDFMFAGLKEAQATEGAQ